MQRIALLLLFLLAICFAGPATAQTAESLSPHGDVDIPCENCHTSQAWRPVMAELLFDHNSETEYELVGTHAVTPCRGCHLELRLDQPKLDGDPCGQCHVDVHQGRFIESCETCHDMESFEEVNPDQVHNTTAFPLTGAHRNAACQSCHTDDIDGGYTHLDTNCFACHDVVFEVAPGHIEQNFPTTCESCHTTFSWTDVLFDHALVSEGFNLVGSHAVAPCSSCHNPANDFEPLFTPANDNDCFSCHEPAFERQHANSGFPTTCLSCHNTTTWSDASFSHAAVANGFQLIGAHAVASCSSCHNTANSFEPLFTPANQNDCFSCHEADYERRHGGSGFSTNCLNCHTTDSWNR